MHIAGYVRSLGDQRLFCIFNFGSQLAWLSWLAFKEIDRPPFELFDRWSGKTFKVGDDSAFLEIEPYGFYLLEQVNV